MMGQPPGIGETGSWRLALMTTGGFGIGLAITLGLLATWDSARGPVRVVAAPPAPEAAAPPAPEVVSAPQTDNDPPGPAGPPEPVASPALVEPAARAPEPVAAGPADLVAYSTRDGVVNVALDAQRYLTLRPAAWGPNWSYAGISGTATSRGGFVEAELSARLGTPPQPVAIRMSVFQTDPRTLALDLELKAEAATPLTLIILGAELGPSFEGRDVEVVSEDGSSTAFRYPFGTFPIGKRVRSLRVDDAAGRPLTLRFEPACEITADRVARIVLAAGHLGAGETRRQGVTIECPGETRWYPTADQVPQEPGMEGWYAWHGTGDGDGSVIDMTDWIDAPAGRHGRIVRRGEALLADGKPIKLWGLNLCFGACTPDGALAAQRARLYPRYGINAVRLHKYADDPGSGILSPRSFVQFDPARLDRMDEQVARFKNAGIYLNLSPTFGQPTLGPDDLALIPYLEEFGAFQNNRIRVPPSAIFYSPEIQRAQILQMRNLLRHRNPYTKLTYAEDPAIAFLEIVNEQSILFFTSMAPLKASATLRKQVAERFSDWLRQRYGTQAKLEAAWGRPAFDCFTNEGFAAVGERLDRRNILPIGNPWFWDPDQLEGSQAPKRRRLLDTLEFLYSLQCDFYERYVAAIRETGYQGEILGSNWVAGRAYSHFANLHSDYRVGTIDRHNYSGGSLGKSMLSRAGSGMLSSGMQQVIDRPFMLSEWIHVAPSDIGMEGPALLGAYGMGLQGWDASFMFQNNDDGHFSKKLGRDQWDVTAPQVLGVFPAVARQVLRGDVGEAELLAIRNVHVPGLFQGRLGFDDRMVQGYDIKELDSSTVPARALAVARPVVQFTDDAKPTPPFDLGPHLQDGALVSATRQLRWHEAGPRTDGFVTIDSPGTKAVIGQAAGRSFDLGEVRIEPQSRFGATYVTARRPGETVATARDLLIVAVGRARNTGMKYAPAGDEVLIPGGPPILMEPLKTRLTLRGRTPVRVTLLDHDGRPTPRTLPVRDGSFTIDGVRDRTPYYRIELAPLR